MQMNWFSFPDAVRHRKVVRIRRVRAAERNAQDCNFGLLLMLRSTQPAKRSSGGTALDSSVLLQVFQAFAGAEVSE